VSVRPIQNELRKRKFDTNRMGGRFDNNRYALKYDLSQTQTFSKNTRLNKSHPFQKFRFAAGKWQLERDDEGRLLVHAFCLSVFTICIYLFLTVCSNETKMIMIFRFRIYHVTVKVETRRQQVPCDASEPAAWQCRLFPAGEDNGFMNGRSCFS